VSANAGAISQRVNDRVLPPMEGGGDTAGVDPQRPDANDRLPAARSWNFPARIGAMALNNQLAGAIGRPNRVPKWLVRQTHDECQSDIQPRDVLFIEMANLSSNSLPPNGDGFIGHNL